MSAIDILSKILWRIKEYKSFNHRHAWRAYREKKRVWHDARAIEELQKHRLVRLMHVHSNNPVYGKYIRSAGIPKNNRFDLHGYLDQFPVMTKRDLTTQCEKLLNRDSFMPRQNSSGGSTGEPVILYQDAHYEKEAMASNFLSDEMQNWFPGCRVVRLWGAPKDIDAFRSPKNRIKLFFKNEKYLDAFYMSTARMEEYVEVLRTFDPDVIVAYASAAYIFAKFILDRSIPLKISRLRSIISSAETLHDEMKCIIEKAFGVPVYDRYGSREVGIIAAQCHRRRLFHLFPFDHIFETLDERLQCRVLDEPGVVVVTSLNNYAMPIVRYKLEDMAVLTAEKCDCGIAAPCLRRVQGRVSDMIKTRSGRNIHGEFFTHAIWGIPGIVQFRFIQETLDEYRLMLSIDKNYNREVHEPMIREYCFRLLDRGASLDITYHDEIPPLPGSGKRRFTISKV